MTAHLRTPVVLGWIALVLVFLGLALWANDGLGLLNRSALASILLASMLVGCAVFAIVLRSSSAVSSWAFRDGVDVNRAKQMLKFVAMLSGCLGLGILLDAALEQL